MTMNPMLHNLNLLKTVHPSMRYDGKENFTEWQKRARAKLSELLCLQNIEKAENNNFTVEYTKETEEYTETRFTLESEPGYTFPCVLRVPKNAKGKIPLVLCLQGHSTGFHISLGTPIYPRDVNSIAGGDRDFAVRIVKEGYAALAIEQRNFGECGGDGANGPACHVSSMTAIINSRTTIGERVVDVSCAIDAALEHFDFIDEENIVLMGNSGGGTATYYAAAIDERISLAMPSCAVCTYKDSIAAMKHCVCNFIPNIAKYFDMGDLAGLIAPRSLVVVHGVKDDIFPEAGVYESYDIIKDMYKAAGAPDSCALVSGKEGHRFYADDAWPVANKFIKK